MAQPGVVINDKHQGIVAGIQFDRLQDLQCHDPFLSSPLLAETITASGGRCTGLRGVYAWNLLHARVIALSICAALCLLVRFFIAYEEIACSSIAIAVIDPERCSTTHKRRINVIQKY